MWNKFLIYLYIRKPVNTGTKPDINVRFMHGMNRISIFMFLIALIVIVIRYLF
ncbi:MAG: DUF6728 family protein [Bacteroidota bacterium]|nr:DUF6728 family protein [Bacteroidota bacterium]